VLWGRGPRPRLGRARANVSQLRTTRRTRRIVSCWSHGEILRCCDFGLVAAAQAGREPGPRPACERRSPTTRQEVMNLANRLAGSAGMLEGRGPGDPTAPTDKAWAFGFSTLPGVGRSAAVPRPSSATSSASECSPAQRASALVATNDAAVPSEVHLGDHETDHAPMPSTINGRSSSPSHLVGQWRVASHSRSARAAGTSRSSRATAGAGWAPRRRADEAQDDDVNGPTEPAISEVVITLVSARPNGREAEHPEHRVAEDGHVRVRGQ